MGALELATKGNIVSPGGGAAQVFVVEKLNVTFSDSLKLTATLTDCLGEVNPVDILFYRGDSKPLEFTVTDPDGNVVDISGLTNTVFSVKKYVSDTAYVFQKTQTGGSIVLTNPSAGVFEVRPATADTETVEPGNYEFDIQTTDSGGNVHTIARGNFIILGDISRP